MVETTPFNIINLKNEFLNKLRTYFITVDPRERVELKQKSFTADGSKTKFFLNDYMSCVVQVKVNGVIVKFGEAYNIIWRGGDKGSVEFLVAPLVNDEIVVDFGVAEEGNMIYPDFPRTDLGENSYPRIGFKVTVNSERIGGSGVKSAAYNNEILIQIRVIDSDTYVIDSLVQELDDYFKIRFKSFYYVPYIDPQSINEYDDYMDNTEKNHSKIISFRVPYKYDIKQVV